MKPLVQLAAALITSAALLAPPASAQAVMEGGRKLEATLTPPTGGTGTGFATIIVNPGQRRVCWELTVSGLATPASAAHIHDWATSGIVVGLSAPVNTSTGCMQVSREDALDILKNPSAYFVNIHNATFPGGALSGTLANQNQ